MCILVYGPMKASTVAHIATATKVSHYNKLLSMNSLFLIIFNNLYINILYGKG